MGDGWLMSDDGGDRVGGCLLLECRAVGVVLGAPFVLLC